MAEVMYRGTYVGGQFPAAAENFLAVENPATEGRFATVTQSSGEEVSAAIDAARVALPAWRQTPLAERTGALRSLADELERQTERLAQAITAEMGAPIGFARGKHVGGAVATIRAYADALESIAFEYEVENSLVIRTAVGVASCITPWNFPLVQIAMKVPAALAAGCTTVLKPSSLSPISSSLFAEAVHAIGLPAGVFNLVTGPGSTVGETLARHPSVAIVSLTGSTEAGRRVMELASQGLKRVSLELGGKSANLILDDLDQGTFEEAVSSGTMNCFFNAGQGCGLLTRMLVHESRLEEAAEIARSTALSVVVGDPLDEGTIMGPVVGKEQRDGILDHIRSGIDEGARLVCGGLEPPVDGPGYFVAPTVFAGVRPEMRIAREEIFGPVLSIMTYRDEEDALRIANESTYGLLGRVWSADPARAERVARRVEAGQINLNGAGPNLVAPRGGMKSSGIGYELGPAGIEEYLQYRVLNR